MNGFVCGLVGIRMRIRVGFHVRFYEEIVNK